METTKIVGALIFGLLGFWVFSQLGGQEARHILISDTAAHVMENGTVKTVFSIENKGMPDRIIEASSREASVNLHGGTPSIVIPAGRSALALEGAHLVLSDLSIDPAPGTLIPISLTLETAGTITARVRVSDPANAQMDHAAMTHDAAQGHSSETPPTLLISAKQDANGWVIDLDTAHFTFSESGVDGAHVPGQGHAHLYVSGTKIGRVFGPRARIGALPKGTHDVHVTLNTNNHMPYMKDGTAIDARLSIEVD